MCSQQSCFAGQRVWLSIFVEDSGSVTKTPRGSSCRFLRIPVQTKGSSPFPELAVPQPPVPCRLSVSWGQIPWPEAGWWQEAKADRDKLSPLPLSHDISWHKKYQSTGDWLRNCDLVSSLKIKIMCLQITTCSLNNNEQNIYRTAALAVASNSVSSFQASHMG